MRHLAEKEKAEKEKLEKEKELAAHEAAAEEPENTGPPPFGVAKFSLAELCKGTKSLKQSMQVIPATYYSAPSMPEMDLTASGISTGVMPYMECETEITVSVTLQEALRLSTDSMLYARAVFILSRDEDLAKLHETVLTINTQPLAPAAVTFDGSNAPLSEEFSSPIRGVQISDGEQHLVILEGYAEPSMIALDERIPAMWRPASASGPTCTRALSNPRLRFRRLLYADLFPHSIVQFKRSTTVREMQPVRRVPLCENVRTLLTSPETTSRERTSKEAHDALQVVAQLRASKRLYEVKLMNLFPTATMVMALEQRFSPDPTPTTTAIKSI
eukprot:m51a1_g4558 hypothetical protein (330) ;mRNA; r:99340-105719